MKDHKELDAWKLSMDLVVDVYEESGRFPKEEMYGLISQIRRSAVSISAKALPGIQKKGLCNFSISLLVQNPNWKPN